MLDTSLARLRRLLGDSHTDIAKALQNRAEASATADEQRRLLDEAAAVWRRQPDADSTGVAAVFNAQGSERFERGELAEAKPLFEAAIRILDRTVPADHPAWLATAHNLASTLSGLGDWPAAERLTREVIARGERGGPRAGRAVDAEGLALLAAHQGRLAEAEAGLRTSLAQSRARLAPDHWRIDNTLRNLGHVVTARGRVAEGLTILDSAVARARGRAGGADSKGYGGMVGQRVIALIRLGRLAEAEAAVRESDRALRAAVPQGHHYFADLARWKGLVAFAGADAAAAEPHFRESLRLMARRLPPRHPTVAGVDCMLGVALVRQGRVDEGRGHVEAG
jgi:tetratricopeptide (TPR) repeat protein